MDLLTYYKLNQDMFGKLNFINVVHFHTVIKIKQE